MTSFSVPAIPPSPAPPGYTWSGMLQGNGFGGYIWHPFLVPSGAAAVPTPAATTTTTTRTTTIPLSTPGQANFSSSAPPPPQAATPLPGTGPSFDTIGQTIFHTLGHTKTPLVPIWVQGIFESDQTLVPTDPNSVMTITAAWAISQPLDPDETGNIDSLSDGSFDVFTQIGGFAPPSTWSAAEQAQLLLSLESMVIYLGTESQLPDSYIVADKGALFTPAFRDLRYIVIPFYPVVGGVGSRGVSILPRLSVTFRRTNTITTTTFPTDSGGNNDDNLTPNIIAVEFAPGSS